MLTGHLNFDNKDDYQFIFSTLQWVTFYCVYARIITDDDNNLTSLDFYIENYKGPKRGFKNNIDKIEFNDGILRIGAKISTRSNNYELNKSVKHLNINKKNLKSIFFTRDEKYFDDLSTYSERDLTDFTNELDPLEIGEYDSLLERLLKPKEDFTSAAAVGTNCRTSFIKVKYP